MPFSWTCSCGKGMGGWSADRARALQDAEVHRCRQGRLREFHDVAVVSDGAFHDTHAHDGFSASA